MTYDCKAKPTLLEIAEKVLEKIHSYRDETTIGVFGIPQPPHDVDTAPDLWTDETLATELNKWADIQPSRMNEVLAVLMNSGLLTRRDLPLRNYELTAVGKIEVEQLLKMRELIGT
jgi:hypothetical protein